MMPARETPAVLSPSSVSAWFHRHPAAAAAAAAVLLGAAVVVVQPGARSGTTTDASSPTGSQQLADLGSGSGTGIGSLPGSPTPATTTAPGAGPTATRPGALFATPSAGASGSSSAAEARGTGTPGAQGGPVGTGTSHGSKPGGSKPGGSKPGGSKPGGSKPGGSQPGGSKPGGSSGATMFGASLDLAKGGGFARALSLQDSRFGQLGIVRVFYPGFPASWASHPELANRPSIVSFKIDPAAVLSGANDAKLKAWFASAPKNANVYWSYWHEPENDKQLDPAKYRAAWQHISALADTAGNPRLHATLILMGYTTHAGSGRDWRDWYPGSDAIDVMGWDVYNTGAKKDLYSNPATLFAPVIAVAKSVGKPWGIAETGSRLTGDDDGELRAQWLRSATSFLDTAGAQWVAYWDVDAAGGGFKLSDPASISAWRDAVALS